MARERAEKDKKEAKEKAEKERREAKERAEKEKKEAKERAEREKKVAKERAEQEKREAKEKVEKEKREAKIRAEQEKKEKKEAKEREDQAKKAAKEKEKEQKKGKGVGKSSTPAKRKASDEDALEPKRKFIITEKEVEMSVEDEQLDYEEDPEISSLESMISPLSSIHEKLPILPPSNSPSKPNEDKIHFLDLNMTTNTIPPKLLPPSTSEQITNPVNQNTSQYIQALQAIGTQLGGMS